METVEKIMAIANQPYYDQLTEAELQAFIGMGLCESDRLSGWLSCSFCRSKKRQSKCFQGTDQVREHFQDHRLKEAVVAEFGSATAAAAAELSSAVAAAAEKEKEETAAAKECLGVWARDAPLWVREDVVTRLEGAKASLVQTAAIDLLVTSLVSLEGATGREQREGATKVGVERKGEGTNVTVSEVGCKDRKGIEQWK